MDKLESNARVASLLRSEGWAEVVRRCEDRRGRDRQRIMNDMWMGVDLQQAQRDVDYSRGWDAAIEWVTNMPEKAEASLEKELSGEQHRR